MAVPVRNIVCFTLNCSDLERSVAFYLEELGAKELTRMRPEEVEVQDFWGAMGYEAGIGYEAVMLRLGSRPTETYLELIEWKQPGSRIASLPRDIGLTRFSIAVEDADAAYIDLRNRGLNVKGAPVSNRLGNLVIKAFLILDPDNVPIEIVEFGRAENPDAA